MKKRLKRAAIGMLTAVLCFQLIKLPVIAVEPVGRDTSGTVSGGNAETQGGTVSGGNAGMSGDAVSSSDAEASKAVQVQFDNTFGDGLYWTGEEWAAAQGEEEITVPYGEDFCMEMKTEGDSFVSGYIWNNNVYTKGSNTMTSLKIVLEWEKLEESNTLKVSLDKKMTVDDFSITFLADSGVCGSTAVAGLYCREGVQAKLDNTEVVWESNCPNGFAVVGESQVADAVSSCLYAVKENENKEVYAIASIYRNDILLATVQSGSFQMQADNAAPKLTEALYSINGGPFQTFEEGGKIWGLGKITFRVRAADEAETGTGSGVERVNIVVNNTAYRMELNEGNSCYEYTVERKIGQIFIFNIKFGVWDKAGNSILETGYPEFGIDDKKPQVQVELTDGEQEITGWYSEAVQSGSLQLVVKAYDDNEVVKVEIAVQEDFAAENVIYGGIPVLEDGFYILKTPETLLSGEQNSTYYIRAVDKFGNVSNVVPKKVQIDNTPPDEQVSVEFAGTNEMQVQVSGGDAGTHNYVVEKGEGIVYDNDRIVCKLFVQDMAIENKEEAASGIAFVDFKIAVSDGEKETLLQKHIEAKDFIRDESGGLYAYYEAEVPNGTESYEQTFQIQDIVITDNAGNFCPAEDNSKLNDAVLYVMDNKPPQITYTCENGEAVSERVTEGEKICYYPQPLRGFIKIADMNLEEDSILIQNMEGCNAAEIAPKEDLRGDGLWKEAVYTYELVSDGCYRIAVQADDILHNAMTEEGLEKVLSDIMIVDTIKPDITVSMIGGDGQSAPDYGGKYFSTDMMAMLSITDKNLDPDTVTVVVSGKTAEGNPFYEKYDQSFFTKEADKYTGQFNFSKEGSYSIHVVCADMAGNTAEIAGEVFYIDKSEPVVSMEFDNRNATNDFYYNANRMATITVKDYSFCAEGASFIINAQNGGQAVIGEWEHHGGEGCDGSSHTESCTYTAKILFSEDDIYDFSFLCQDRAGLTAPECNGGHFVIDKTDPVINITYSNQEPKNGYYFNEVRTAYITVEDLSFSADEVAINKMEGDNIHALPPLADFVSTGMKHVLSVRFDEDGSYQFMTEAVDLAGNRAEVKYSDYFILDTVAPRLKITDVADRSANNGVVAPVIAYGDKYLSDETTEIILVGEQNGKTVIQSEKMPESDGYIINYADFAYTRKMDDLYTLSAKVEDLAGNISEQSLIFSVNRFGSVYVMGEETKRLLEGYYSGEEVDLRITEINVDRVSDVEITCSHDGELYALTEGRDYTVEKEGTEGTWKAYSYLIDKANFEQEGYYVLMLSSVDEAGNNSDNSVKGTEIAFAIDKTAPSMVAGNIEQNGIYRQESLKVTVDVQDNMSLEEMAVYVDGQVLQSFNRESLEARQGIVSFILEEKDKPVDIAIVAVDAVGNSSELLYDDIIVSTDVRVIRDDMVAKGDGGFLNQWSVRGSVFFIAATGTAALACVLAGMAILKRKKGHN